MNICILYYFNVPMSAIQSVVPANTSPFLKVSENEVELKYVCDPQV